MRRPTKPRELQRSARFETYEERLALSAQPVGDFLLEAHSSGQLEHHYGELAPAEAASPGGDFNLNLRVSSPADNLSGGVQTQLAEAHELTGVNDVYHNYGFDGAGQTVAIIDSGIAYDHVALGGGFGTSYRVVGGWDFAENDANPYDDAPAGFHGTHVAGIVGSDDATYRGVASGADLVALRVFDDNGAGYFSWVEDALRWVHDNRDAFENPITTVNLSLGTSWNADSIPSWATLEDEFAQLELDGIFIAVSAGNSFAEYNAPGLSYPAASSHVVPVASVDDTGLLSDFSQRNDRVLAAPGRAITSTVPDYIFGADGNPNDFGTASGTSMAAPYAAGASVLVRQAMEFVGMQHITQDTIYDQLRATADVVYDPATNASYHRINVQAAIDALMPADDYGSTAADAYDLGTIKGKSSLSGLIGATTDQDFFTFTAGVTGNVSFDFGTNHQHPTGYVSGVSSTFENDVLQFSVSAGERYTIALGSNDGIGYYNVVIDAEAAFSPVELGTIDFRVLANQTLASEAWYSIQATRDGFLSVEALFDQENGHVDIELYDASLTQVAASASATGNERVDTEVSADDVLYLHVVGDNQAVDLRLANLVSLAGNHLSIFGTNADDSITIDLTSLSVSIDNLVYSFHSVGSGIESISIEGGDGKDELVVRGTDQDETAVFKTYSTRVSNSSLTLDATNVENTRVDAAGGANNLAQFYDSSGDDVFTAGPAWARMSGEGYVNSANGFARNDAVANAGGNDRAEFYDSSGDDTFTAVAHRNEAYLTGNGFFNYAHGFARNYAFAVAGGNDRADFHDSNGDDHFMAVAHRGEAYMLGAGFFNYAKGFERNYAFAVAGGNDRADFHDSSGDDHFVADASRDEASMVGAGFQDFAKGFERNYAYAVAGGNDRADFYDSSGDDRFVAMAHRGEASMVGAGFYDYAKGFERNYAFAVAGGNDRADFYDSSGDDRFVAVAHRGEAYMLGPGIYNFAKGFERNYAFAVAGGNDRADFHDSSGDDHFIAVAHRQEAYMLGSGFYNFGKGFERNYAFAVAGGNDRADFHDSSGDDYFAAAAQQHEASMLGTGFYNRAKGFERNYAFAVAGGNDRADVFGASDHNSLIAHNDYALLTYAAGLTQVVSFESVKVECPLDVDNVEEIGAVDYLFEQIGQWAAP